MHISILSHQTQKHGLSSRFLVDYLEKENEGKTKDTEHLHRLPKERFFNSTTLENPDLILDKNEVISSLDKNRGTRKLKESNYYMLNISPSKKELEHMENLAINDLERRGIQNKKSTSLYYLEQKEALIKHQLKLYTNDVMAEYAKSMNREIYCHEDKLPYKESKKLLEEKTDKVFSDFLKEQGIIMQEALKEDPETPKTEEVSTQEQDPQQEATDTKEAEASKDKIYKGSHWINIDASIVEKDSSKKTVTLEVLLDGKYEKIIVPTTMGSNQKWDKMFISSHN